MEEGFYKLEVGQKRSVLLFATHLESLEWTLTLENKDNFTFPHDGWSYFNSLSDACSYYDIDEEEWREILFPTESEEIEVL